MALAYSIENEPPKWLREKVEFFILCGYSAKRISELVPIPEWYIQHMKTTRQYGCMINGWGTP